MRILAWNVNIILAWGMAMLLWSSPKLLSSDKVREAGLLESFAGRKYQDEELRGFMEEFGSVLAGRLLDETFSLEFDDFARLEGRTVHKLNYVFSPQFPIEFIFEREQTKYYDGELVLSIIRIGYPLGGRMFSFVRASVPQAPRVEREAFLDAAFSKADSLFPFDLKSGMDPESVIRLLKRPYFHVSESLNSVQSGSIDFGSREHDPPFPVVVWFYEGKLCGVDLYPR